MAPDVPDVSAITPSLLQVTDSTQDLEHIRQALYWLSHTPAQQVWFAFQIIRG